MRRDHSTRCSRRSQGLSSFVGSLPSGVDYRVAVMQADVSTSAKSGLLFSATGIPVVSNSTQLSLNQITTNIATNLKNMVIPNGVHSEFGLLSFFNSLQPQNIAKTQAQGFYRPECRTRGDFPLQ